MTNEHPPTEAADSGTPHPEEPSRRDALKLIGGAALAGAAVAAAIGYIETRGPGTAAALVCGRAEGDLPLDDPLASAWIDRDYFAAKMLAQNITTPLQLKVEVPEVRVRAMHDGKTIAFHLQWSDASEDAEENMAVFRDAVAVQLEVDPQQQPSFTMGNVDGPVHILQWRASWQADIDLGHQGVKQLFPNAYNDVSPETLMSKEQAISFYPARLAKNAAADHDRTSPVEELTAIGFGSLTAHTQQSATGKGVHKNRMWQVIIALPMGGTDKTKARVAAGETRNVAFAVWNGEKGQRGARKQYFPWTPMSIEA